MVIKKDVAVLGVEFLLQRNGVELVKSRATLRDERTVVARGKDAEAIYEAGAVILATGIRPNSESIHDGPAFEG